MWDDIISQRNGGISIFSIVIFFYFLNYLSTKKIIFHRLYNVFCQIISSKFYMLEFFFNWNLISGTKKNLSKKERHTYVWIYVYIYMYICVCICVMLRAILNKSWQQHPTRHQLYGHLPPITKTIQFRRTRHAGHCWRSRDELIRDVLLWIPTHGRPARTYIQQLCEDTGCCPEDLPRAMNDREEWRERVRDIRAASTIWWWWWYV